MMKTIALLKNQLPEVISIGLIETKEPWLHKPREVFMDTFIYVIEGNFYVNDDGVDITLPKGHILFLKNGSKQYGTKVVEKGTKWFWVTFNQSHSLTSDNKKLTSYPLPKSLNIHNSDYIYNSLLQMNSIYSSDSHFKVERLNGFFHQILLEILAVEEMIDTSYPKKELSTKVIKLLNQQLEYKLSTDNISKNLSMNYSYIGRVFKEETGTTISHYYAELKIKLAIQLMHATNLNLSQISERLNYPSIYYFSRVFKKMTGLSPSHYRQTFYY